MKTIFYSLLTLVMSVQMSFANCELKTEQEETGSIKVIREVR